MDVQAFLADSAARVDAVLDARVPPAEEPPAPLHAAMRHLLFPGGKRLRPAFVFGGARAAGADPARAAVAAAAVELIHIYSLVHDDLPCMDDDALRRGRPTVHVVFGESTAVLAGDALQALAFELLAGGERPGESVAALARAAGSRELVGGQVDDLAVEPDAELALVLSIHRRKSAALFEASVELGGLAGDAPDGLRERLRRFGREAGIAFQIADDLLDRDREEPCSAVRVLGEAGARSRAREHLAHAEALLEGLGEPAEPLRQLAQYGVERDR